MKNIITKDPGFKVLALVFALTLWFFVTLKGQSEITIEVPLEYKNIPAGFEITKKDVSTVNIAVQGQERIVKNLNQKDISIYIDMSNAKEGEGVYYLRKEDIRIPPILTVNEVSPASAKVILEKTVGKRVVIKPLITGTPLEGYYVKGLSVSPPAVEIVGAQSLIQKMTSIKTDLIDVSNKNASFEENVRISFEGKNIKAQRERVTVRIVIEGEKK